MSLKLFYPNFYLLRLCWSDLLNCGFFISLITFLFYETKETLAFNAPRNSGDWAKDIDCSVWVSFLAINQERVLRPSPLLKGVFGWSHFNLTTLSSTSNETECCSARRLRGLTGTAYYLCCQWSDAGTNPMRQWNWRKLFVASSF